MGSNKRDKLELFDLERVSNDFATGQLESVVARSDFRPGHAPHIDLSVRPPGQQQIKYRIYDANGVEYLRDRFGQDGLEMP